VSTAINPTGHSLQNIWSHECFVQTAYFCERIVTVLRRHWHQEKLMSRVQFFWKDAAQVKAFRTGVCLPGHTLRSEEWLNFLPRYLHYVPGVSQVVSRYE